jgi:hypothetical protein
VRIKLSIHTKPPLESDQICVGLDISSDIGSKRMGLLLDIMETGERQGGPSLAESEIPRIKEEDLTVH